MDATKVLTEVIEGLQAIASGIDGTETAIRIRAEVTAPRSRS